jgi:hypothetical protein
LRTANAVPGRAPLSVCPDTLLGPVCAPASQLGLGPYLPAPYAAPNDQARRQVGPHLTTFTVHVAAPVATDASTPAISRSRHYQAVLAAPDPQNAAAPCRVLAASRPPTLALGGTQSYFGW